MSRLRFENLECRKLLTEISGILTENDTWGIAGSPYELRETVVIAEGITIDVEPGVLITRTGNTVAHLFVDGELNLDGARLDGDFRVTVNGELKADNTEFANDLVQFIPGGDEFIFSPSSRGTVQNSSFPVTHLQVFSPNVEFANNRFETVTPVTTNPSFVSNFHGTNEYTAEDTILFVAGHTAGNSASWLPHENLSRYSLFGTVVITEGDTIEIEPGIHLLTQDGGQVSVNGSLLLDSVDVTDKTFFIVEGEMTVRNSTFDLTSANPGINIRSNSVFSMTGSTMQQTSPGNIIQMEIDSRANQFHASCNQFLAGNINAVGADDMSIDLANNSWGTQSLQEIEARVNDKQDFDFLPDILISPILSDFPCPDSTGPHNALLAEDATGDGAVSPLDALLVINELTNRAFSRESDGLIVGPTPVGLPFPDIDDNGFISPLDALLVINALTTSSIPAASVDTVFSLKGIELPESEDEEIASKILDRSTSLWQG